MGLRVWELGLMGGSDYKTPPAPPQTSPDQNKRGAPNQVREKLFGGAGPIPILRGIQEGQSALSLRSFGNKLGSN